MEHSYQKYWIPAPRFHGGKFIPAEAGTGMTMFIPHSAIRIPHSDQLRVTKYTPTQMIRIPVIRVIERFSWNK